MSLNLLLKDIRNCRICEQHLPLGANPVVVAKASARLLIVGQAPGTKVHASKIPWNDLSGDRLRDWLQLTPSQFYDQSKIAIVPMGFCYPGKGKSGDLPPRPECASQWHQKLLEQMPNIELTLLIGQYAQKYYLSDKPKTLTQTVKEGSNYLPDFLPLPHPSPRNQIWLKKNPWFEKQVVPKLRKIVWQLLGIQGSV